MDEELQNALVDAISSFSSGIQGASEFAISQAPDVIQQLLLRDLVFSLMAFSFGALLVIGAVVIWKVIDPVKAMQRIEEQKADARAAYERGEKWTRHGGSSGITSVRYDEIMRGDTDGLKCLRYAGGGTALMVGISLIAANFDWLTILIAPKVYILEYAATLAL